MAEPRVTIATAAFGMAELLLHWHESEYL